MDEDRDHLTTRRDSLVKASGLLVAAIGAKSVLTGGAAAATEGTGPAAVASGALTCVLTPELTEGPFYLPGEKVRRNITEGRPGTPLTLKLKVVNASTCRAIKGAAVDIWHADAGGTYSGVQGSPGTSFMRGIQPTGAGGVGEFLTVYPGWYQ
ncbi:MAG: dioxygenase family protein, partial [Gaiellaceae bacterium]